MQVSGVIPDDVGARRSGEIKKRSLVDSWVIGVDGYNLNRRVGGGRQGQGYRCRDDEFVVVLEVQHETVTERDPLYRTASNPVLNQFLFGHAFTLLATRHLHKTCNATRADIG